MAHGTAESCMQHSFILHYSSVHRIKVQQTVQIWYSTVIKKDKIYFLLLIQLKKMPVWRQFAFGQEKYKIQLGSKLSSCRRKFFPVQPIYPINICMSLCGYLLAPLLFLQNRTSILSLQFAGLSSAEFFPSLLQSTQQIWQCLLLVDL